jgi:amino acid adenylation domain-containing protein
MYYLKEFNVEIKVPVNLPISEYQKRFFLEWMLSPNKYNVLFTYKIISGLDKNLLKQSCEIFTQSHEAFYACYSQDGNSCYRKNYTIDDFYHHYKLLPEQNMGDMITQIISAPFDLSKDPLLSLYLLENNEECYFIFKSHHIISDMTTATIFCQQLSYIYKTLLTKERPILPIQSFSQAVATERELLTAEYLSGARDYWSDFLKGALLRVDLPYKSSEHCPMINNNYESKKSNIIYFELFDYQVIALKKYARKNKTTLFIILAAVYGTLIARYSNQEQIILNYPVNLRPKGYENLAGCFFNNIPLKVELNKCTLLSELLALLTTQRRCSKQFQRYPILNIVQDAREKYQYVDDLFNVCFGQSNYYFSPLTLEGVEIHNIEVSSNHGDSGEMVLLYNEFAEGRLKFTFEYRRDLFDEQLIQGFLASFTDLIDKVTAGEDVDLKTYSLLDRETYNQQIYLWSNQGTQNYSRKKTVFELFEDQVAQNPNSIAVVFEDRQLSYSELNNKANALAHYLRATYQIKAGDLVALYLNRNEDMIIAILAVLKSGAAYVPIGPADSAIARTKHIIDDTQAKLIITNEANLDKLATLMVDHEIKMEAIDSASLHVKLSKCSTNNLEKIVNGSDLAYVIYTSGSTGMPKGVMIEHTSLYAFCYNNNFLTLNKDNIVLGCSNYAFDGCCFDVFYTLSNGAQLILTSEVSLLNSFEFSRIVKTYQPDTLFITTKLLEQYIEIHEIKLFSNFKSILFGGEKGNPRIIQKLISHKSLAQQVIHVYGPTENVIFSTFAVLSNDNVELLPVGKALADKACYILDRNLQPVPIGVVGELYIGGTGIARGYVNRQDLTQERFLINPFQTDDEKSHKVNARIYKTGDLVRYLPSGDIEYIGRNDFQLKISGYRIELSEIENVLINYSGVKQAIVIAKDNCKCLVAYYTADHEIEVQLIIDYLGKYLPLYMIPTMFVPISIFPLTNSGKLNRNALPDSACHEQVNNFVAPSTDLEKCICAMYAQVLKQKIEHISIHNDFFKIGGNSLLLIELFIKLTRVLNINIKDIFKYRTPSAIINFATREHLIINEQGLINQQAEKG